MTRKGTRDGVLLTALSLVLLAGISTSPATAVAQSKGGGSAKDAKAEALELFNQSADLYQQGKFDEAARLLERAYEIQPEPVLLYNLGRAYEGLGENQKAVEAYEHYLKDEPKAKDRGAVEHRIETLKAQIERDKK